MRLAVNPAQNAPNAEPKEAPVAVDVLSPRAVAEAWFAALDRGDIPAAVALLADDIYWENIAQVPGVSDIVPWTGTARGVSEVGQAFATRDEVCQVIEFKPLNMVVDGNQAVGTVHDHAIIKSTGLPFDIEFASWMKIENGKIVWWKSYCDPSPIIAAFRGDATARVLQAVKANNLEEASFLLSHKVNPNVRDPETGLTALMLAACHAQPDMVKLLLDAGADPLTVDTNTGATALHKACQGGNVEVARLLLDAGSFIDAVTPTMGHTPVMDALWYKAPEVVDLLVERGANLNLSTHYGFTMWDHLAFELNVNVKGRDIMEGISNSLEGGRDAKVAQIAAQPVMVATEKGDLDGVKQAIADGADVNALYPHVNTFSDGHTPLLVAARDNHADIVQTLLAAGAKVRVEDWVFKGSPIHKATYNGNPGILKMLMEQPDIDLDVQGKINGYSPLHDALWHGYTECAQMLIFAGARLDTRGHDGKLPVDVALDVYGADDSLVALIRERMAATTPASAPAAS
jgi:ankyrin repeat protein/ketosteroid isomerase-like protein